jgi:V8-like Glu-specific endopeptidase
MRRSRSIVLSAMLVSLVLPVASAPVLAGDPAAAARDRTIAYWTAERIANARPRDFARTPGGQFVPAAGKPPGGGGGKSVIGASWTKGGQVLVTTGKVLFTLDSGDWICTGTVVTDGIEGRSMVISAAHCAWDGADGGFARNWTFIPEFDTTPTYTCGQAKWGCWTASALVVNKGYTSAGGFNTQAVQYDWSFAVITEPGNKYGSLDGTVGSFAVNTTTMGVGDRVFDFGYPAAGKYHGSDLVYCADQVFNDVYTANKTFGIDCDMTGGSSGGPWLNPFTESTGVGTVRAVTSYGYSGVKRLYASKFNLNTANTFGAAKSATDDTIVD